MAELKTRPTNESVDAFLDKVDDPQKRKDCYTIRKLMGKATGQPAVMWGPSIVGFGSRHLKYASGRELDWPIMAFSPRKQNLTLYITEGYDDYKNYSDLLAKLGKHSTSKACLYIKRLSDVDLGVLTALINKSAKLNKDK